MFHQMEHAVAFGFLPRFLRALPAKPGRATAGPARRSIYLVIGLCGAHYTRAMPENDPRCRPAFDRRLIGRGRHLEIIDPDDVLEDLTAGMVPNVDAKLKMRLVLHGTR